MMTIGAPRPLTRDDMALHLVPTTIDKTPAKLRETHHRIARLAAAGLRRNKIAELTGYSSPRISNILAAPATQELIAHYRAEVDESFRSEMDDFHRMALSNMQTAEDLIADRLADAVDEGREIPIRDLVAISADRADRFGYPKQTQSANINVNWADELERRRNEKRSEQRNGE